MGEAENAQADLERLIVSGGTQRGLGLVDLCAEVLRPAQARDVEGVRRGGPGRIGALDAEALQRDREFRAGLPRPAAVRHGHGESRGQLEVQPGLVLTRP